MQKALLRRLLRQHFHTLSFHSVQEEVIFSSTLLKLTPMNEILTVLSTAFRIRAILTMILQPTEQVLHYQVQEGRKYGVA